MGLGLIIAVSRTRDDQCATTRMEGGKRRQLCVGIVLRLGQAARGYIEHDRRVLLVTAGGNQRFGGGQQLHTDAAAVGKRDEVVHEVLVVARHILVAVGGVDADIGKLRGVQHIQLHGGREGVFLAVHLHNDRRGDGGQLCRLGGIDPCQRQRAVRCKRVGVVVDRENLGAVGRIDHALDDGIVALAVMQGRRDGQFLSGQRSCGVCFHLVNAELQVLTDPHGRGNCQIAVRLGHADIVIGVIRTQLRSQNTLGELRRIVPCVGNLSGVDDQLHLRDGIGVIRIHDGDIEFQLLRDTLNDGAHGQVIDRVEQLEILVLGGVDAVVADGVVDALLGKALRQHDITGVVGIAPLALVVVLIVGRRKVPALVQSQRVLLVAGIVAACTDLTFAVANLDQMDTLVRRGAPIAEVHKVAEGVPGVVKLGDGVDALVAGEQLIIGLQARVARLVVQGGVVTRNDTLGDKGIYMSGAAGPCHFKAGDRKDIGMACIKLGDGILISRPALAAVLGGLIQIKQRVLGVGFAGLVKIV